MIPLNNKRLIAGIVLLLLSTIGIAMSMMPLPPGNELKELLQDIPRLNKALEKEPELLSNTRLQELDLSGLVMKNAKLTNIIWRNIKLTEVVLENVTIEKAKWVGVKCKNCTLRNTTFNKSTLDQDRDVKHGGSNFIKGVMDNVHFIDSELLDVEIDELEPSRLIFERITLKNDANTEAWQDTGSIWNSVLHLHFKDSKIYGPRMGNLIYPSEIIFENSHIEEGTTGSRLKRLEIRNSHFEGSGPAYADYVYIADSTIHIRIPEARFAHLRNNEYLNDRDMSIRSSGVKIAKTLIIDGCKMVSSFTLTESRIEELYLRGCQFLHPMIKIPILV